MNDALGHPIRKGDTVVTSQYWSTIMDFVTKVEKVTKNYVYIRLKTNYWCHETKKHKKGYKLVRRYPYQVLVVTQQLEYNQIHYPENLL